MPRREGFSEEAMTELREAQAAMVAPGTRWRHWRTGEIYVVTGFTVDEKTNRLRVSYRPLLDFAGVPWSRPFVEWFEKADAATSPRFSPVPKARI